MLGLATQEVMKLPGINLQFITELLLIFLLSTLRIGAFLLSSPIFGARWLPLQGWVGPGSPGVPGALLGPLRAAVAARLRPR